MSWLLPGLVEINLAAGGAILFVLLVRRPMARHLGPHAAYALWAIVPVAMAATLLPERTLFALETDFLFGDMPAAGAVRDGGAAFTWLPSLLSALWLGGMIALAALFVRRQRAFMRDAEIGLAGPAIVGFRNPRIVTPDDFSHRFSHDERKLIITHEQVHLERSDARINAIVAVLRCVFWFNPLVHVGAKAMRIDQELSCDAEVVERRPRVRRAYAETLLKTHISAQALPVGCHWPAEAQHPLAERIDLLARRPVSARRRAVAAVLVVSLAGGAGFAAWAAQPERTVIREGVDVLVPFRPIPRDERDGAMTRATLVPSSFEAPAMPHHWRGESEVVAELCLSAAGRVESVALVSGSGDKRIDAASLAALNKARFEPAKRDGVAVAACNQRITVEFTTAGSRPGGSPP
jgi:TonB family protein